MKQKVFKVPPSRISGFGYTDLAEVLTHVLGSVQGLNAPTQRDDDRTMEFLYAAARGDTTKLRHVGSPWHSPMLACQVTLLM